MKGLIIIMIVFFSAIAKSQDITSLLVVAYASKIYKCTKSFGVINSKVALFTLSSFNIYSETKALHFFIKSENEIDLFLNNF